MLLAKTEKKHILSCGLSNLALGNPFHSTLKSGIWSTSSNLQFGQNSSSTIYSISWPSYQLQHHIFLCRISAFQCRTMLILYRDLMLPAELLLLLGLLVNLIIVVVWNLWPDRNIDDITKFFCIFFVDLLKECTFCPWPKINSPR